MTRNEFTAPKKSDFDPILDKYSRIQTCNFFDFFFYALDKMCEMQYHEAQVNNHCTIHALNTYTGKKVLSFSDLKKVVEEDKEFDRYRSEILDYAEEEGFNLDVVANWARKHLDIYLWHVGDIAKPGSKAKFLKLLAKFPSTKEARRAIFTQNHHSMTLSRVPLQAEEKQDKKKEQEKKKQAREQWSVIDSLEKQPKWVGSKKGQRPWRDIYGIFFVDVGKQEYERLSKLARERRFVDFHDSDSDEND